MRLLPYIYSQNGSQPPTELHLYHLCLTKHEDDMIIIVLLWVDDIIVAASIEHLLSDVKD